MENGLRIEYAIIVFNEESRSREGVVVGRHHNGKVVIVNRLAERAIKMNDIWFGMMMTSDEMKYWIFTPMAKIGKLGDVVEDVVIPRQRHVVFAEDNCPEVDGITKFEWHNNVVEVI